jgi:DNA helicase II / ATP-dependent DNA helicase PcrA
MSASDRRFGPARRRKSDVIRYRIPRRYLDHRSPAAGSREKPRIGDRSAHRPRPASPIRQATSRPIGSATGSWPRLQGVGNLRYSEWPVDLERARLWYEPHLDRIHEDAETRRADLIQLEQIACGYPSRERFLTELTLDPPDGTSDQAGVPLLDEDYLILSTIHSAKGQEWKSVYLLNAVDGCMPSDLGVGTSAEIEEERCLLYVAMTREGRRTSDRAPTLFRPRAARTARSSPLCFEDTLHTREAARIVRAHGLARCRRRRRARSAGQGAKVDIGARMRGMWR